MERGCDGGSGVVVGGGEWWVCVSVVGVVGVGHGEEEGGSAAVSGCVGGVGHRFFGGVFEVPARSGTIKLRGLIFAIWGT